MKPFRLILLSLAVVSLAHAQFSFPKLPKGLDKGLDTMKDVGKVAKATAKIGPREEEEIGQTVALEIVGRYGGVVHDEDIMRRINLVGRSVARSSSRPELDWRFAVVESPSINAFSAPDGWVFITRGLYELATKDDELAAILGHEIAHISLRHSLTIVERAQAVSGATSLATKYSGDARELESKLNRLNLTTEKVLTALFEKGFDPLLEYDADKEGCALAATCGYSTGGLREVLTELDHRKGDSRDLFPTHPPLKERIKRLPN